jgi:hypothetical protein
VGKGGARWRWRWKRGKMWRRFVPEMSNVLSRIECLAGTSLSFTKSRDARRRPAAGAPAPETRDAGAWAGSRRETRCAQNLVSRVPSPPPPPLPPNPPHPSLRLTLGRARTGRHCTHPFHRGGELVVEVAEKMEGSPDCSGGGDVNSVFVGSSSAGRIIVQCPRVPQLGGGLQATFVRARAYEADVRSGFQMLEQCDERVLWEWVSSSPCPHGLRSSLPRILCANTPCIYANNISLSRNIQRGPYC